MPVNLTQARREYSILYAAFNDQRLQALWNKLDSADDDDGDESARCF
jgi:hypothetical protein